MIEFKKNGPFEPEETPKDDCVIKLIGVGGAGTSVLDHIVMEQPALGNLLCMDTDRQAVTGSVVPEKIMLGERSLRGLGTHGDPDLAIEAFEENWEELQDRLIGTDIAIVVAGLGGGTGGCVAAELLDRLRELSITTVAMGVTPFKCEGRRRLMKAAHDATELRRRADAALLFSNERLINLPEAQDDLRNAFHALNSMMALTCKSISVLLGRQGLVQLKLSDLQSLVGRCEGLHGELENCWVGMGISNSHDREEDVVEQVLHSPLLSDGLAWEAGDRIMACIEGGSDLSVSEYQRLMDALKKELPAELPLKAGASINPNLHDALVLTLFVGRSGESQVATADLSSVEVGNTEDLFERAQKEEEEFHHIEEEITSHAHEEEDVENEAGQAEPLPALDRAGRKQALNLRQQRYFNEQGELPLDSKVLRGRFEKSDPTMKDGENLDQPTFLRRQVKIRL